MSENPAPALSVDDLTVAYRGVPAIWDVDASVPEGVLLGIVGPNGAGKTTLLRAATQPHPASGRVPCVSSGSRMSGYFHRWLMFLSAAA